jgi:argininosuccinate synthase
MLTVKADDETKIYDGAAFSPFTRTVMGFVNGENASVVSGTVTYKCHAHAVAAGSGGVLPRFVEE